MTKARVDAEEVARAVFQVLANSITAGEVQDIRHVLPKALITLWPTSVQQGR